jgi:hypothetical protein
MFDLLSFVALSGIVERRAAQEDAHEAGVAWPGRAITQPVDVWV